MQGEVEQHFQSASACAGCYLQICSYLGNPALMREQSNEDFTKKAMGIYLVLIIRWSFKNISGVLHSGFFFQLQQILNMAK